MKQLASLHILLLMALAGCGPEPSSEPTAATAIIGRDGGQLELDGATAVFPEWAVLEDTEIRLLHGSEDGTSRWILEASGTPAFVKAASLTLPIEADGPVVGFWTPEGGPTSQRPTSSGEGQATLRVLRPGTGWLAPSAEEVATRVFRPLDVFPGVEPPLVLQDLRTPQFLVLGADGFENPRKRREAETGVIELVDVPTDALLYAGIEEADGSKTWGITRGLDPELTVVHPESASPSPEVPREGTELALTVEGLGPWYDGYSRLGAYSSSGLSMRYEGSLGGATRFEWSFDWTSDVKPGTPLIRASKGDILLVAQHGTRETPWETGYWTVQAYGVVDHLEMIEGQGTHVDVPLASPAFPPTEPIVLDFGLIHAWRGGLGPDSEYDYQPAFYLVDPETAMDLMAVPWVPSDLDRVDLSDFLVPVVSGVEPVVYLIYRQVYSLPQGKSGAARMYAEAPLSAIRAGTFAAALAPPTDLRVNGEAADRPLTGIGSTPTIGWKAPDPGEPSGYALRYPTATGGHETSVVPLDPNTTEVVLPPLVDVPAEGFRIRILASETVDATSAGPGRPVGAKYFTEAYTSMLTR